MTRRVAAVAACCAAALACSTVASASVVQDAATARRGLTRALQRHWLEPPVVQQYRTDVSVALRDIRTLPPLRGRILTSQLAQLTPLWDSYTSPRALALFSQLEENVAYLETHRIPAAQADVTGDDGIVYRWFPGLGLEFHPLASFGALNAAVAANDATTTQMLADALVARAIPRGQRLIWEYSFPLGAGRPPWASGMAQAVGAQALARAAGLLGDQALAAAARGAYASVAPLALALPSGPWIRLYGFDREVVLNAQLQTIVSLFDYAQTSGDPAADALAEELSATAQTLFPRFDTGEWSLYELGGGYASRGYQTFVTDLLAKLAARTGDPFWVATSQRFHDYLYSPPQVTEGTAPGTIYPQPADGYLDTAAIPVTLSQKASVTLAVAGQVSTFRLSAGPHVLTWTPAAGLAPGTYPARISAVTYAGNRATVALAPVVVAWDTTPPPTTAQLSGSTLTWQATDPGTPWVDLAVDLVDPAGMSPPQTLELGEQALTGTLPLSLPSGTWQATLRATNSAGLTTSVELGQTVVPAPAQVP